MHSALLCNTQEPWAVLRVKDRRDFEREGRKFPQLPKIKTREAEEDGDLSGELGK